MGHAGFGRSFIHPIAFHLALGALGLALVSAPRPAAARESSFEALVRDFQGDAAPALRALVAGGHRVAVAVDPALPEDARTARAFIERLAGRLAALPPQPPRAALEAAPAGAPGAPQARPVLLDLLPLDGGGARDRTAVVHEAWRRGWSRVLRVEVFVQRGRLVLLGELLVTDGLLWEPALRPVAGITGHFYSAAALDAELRALLDLAPPPLPATFETRPLPVLPTGAPAVSGHVLDLAIGDVDGDEDAEVLVLTRTALHVLRAVEGALAPAGAPLELVPLAGAAAATSRLPVGALALVPLHRADRPDVLVATSDLAATALLAWQGDSLRPLLPEEAAPAPPVCAADGAPPEAAALLLCGFPVGEGAAGDVLLQRRARGRATFVAELDRWRPGAVAALPPAALRGAGLGMRRRWLKTAAEGGWRVVDARLSTAGTLRIGRSDDPTQPPRAWRRLPGVGFAFTLLDWDGDGVPELAAASAAPPGSRDALRLWTLPLDGPPRELLRHETDPVQAIAAGDVDHDGETELLAATHRPGAPFSHIWIVSGGAE